MHLLHTIHSIITEKFQMDIFNVLDLVEVSPDISLGAVDTLEFDAHNL